MGRKGVGGKPRERERGGEREGESRTEGEHDHVETVRSRYLLNYYDPLQPTRIEKEYFSLGTLQLSRIERSC